MAKANKAENKINQKLRKSVGCVVVCCCSGWTLFKSYFLLQARSVYKSAANKRAAIIQRDDNLGGSNRERQSDDLLERKRERDDILERKRERDYGKQWRLQEEG